MKRPDSVLGFSLPFDVSWRKEFALLTIYISSAILLIYTSISNRIEFQDSWSLAGLELQTLFFTIAFAIYAVYIKNNSKLVVLLSTYVLILSAVPNLKYFQIMGAFDSIAHMGYASKIVTSGYVPTTGFYSKEYSGVPGMHIFLASLSQVTGFSMTDTIKILLLTLAFLFPLVTYYFGRRVFNKTYNRFIIYSLCVTLPVHFSLFGTSFAQILYFIFISTFLSYYFTAKNFSYIIILILTGASLIISHGVTPFFLSVLLCSFFALTTVYNLLFRKEINQRTFQKNIFYLAIIITASLLVWWFFKSPYLFNTLINNVIRDIFSSEPNTQIIPTKFFEINLLQQLVILFMRFYDMSLVVSLSLLGMGLYYFKVKKVISIETRTVVERIIFITICMGLISSPFIFILKSYTFERFYAYFKPISPVLIGLSLMTLFFYFKSKIDGLLVSKIIRVFFLIILLVPIILNLFIYQPMVPIENNEYIVDYRSVNTIYQSDMINFAEDHYVKGLKIGSDPVTLWQMAGLTGTRFFSGYAYIDPLTEDYSKVDLILLHYLGISGPLNERLEYRTPDKLNLIKISLGNNIIYDNGESFIILTNFK